MKPVDTPTIEGRPLPWWMQRILPLVQSPVISWRNAVSLHLALPGLRGLWPMTSVSGATGGNAFDVSGNDLTLTYNGNPTYNYSTLIPYIDFDGTGDFLHRADEAALDILGNESYIASAANGLTIGGWFRPDGVARAQYFMAKWEGAGHRSYLLDVTAANALQFSISNDLTNAFTATSASTSAAATWFHLVGRFVPSTSVDLFTNGVKASTTAGIPATIGNSDANLGIGGSGAGSSLVAGWGSMCFLCAAALSDTVIQSIYREMRPMYGL